MYVFVYERERVMYVCVSVLQARECVCVREWEREKLCVCERVCVCRREWEYL